MYLSSFKKIVDEACEQDLASSGSLAIFKEELGLGTKILSLLNNNLKFKERLLDLGIGYGFMTYIIKEILDFKEAYGIDIDCERLSVAQKRGVNVIQRNIENDPLPFPDEYFDLVMVMGLFHHLKIFDNVLSETKRILKPNGILLISDTNMGWWVDRLCLLLGFQPPEVEVSTKYVAGLPNFYPRKMPIGYVHSITLRGMEELLSCYGFNVLKDYGAKIPLRFLESAIPGKSFHNTIMKAFVKTTDRLLSKRPTLAVRYYIISQRI